MNGPRQSASFEIFDIELFKKQLLHWSIQFDHVCWLDSNSHDETYNSYDAIMAADSASVLECPVENAFQNLSDYRSKCNDWIFGYLSYDLKNDIEELHSQNYDGPNFPDMFFFQPRRLVFISGNKVTFSYLDETAEEIQDDLKTICKWPLMTDHHMKNDVKIKLRTHKDEYFHKVDQILSHIYRGDIYEVNFCQEFYAEETTINPIYTYQNLNRISRPPFATFLRNNDHYLLSASPERFLKKEGSKVISQPIKGTAKRSENKDEDEALKQKLAKDPKERSENIMIVDLVRNDLSRVAVKGSVQVDELCKVYTFDQVHQMISTVVGEVQQDVDPVDIIRSCFPMGSMTGAPKISAMKIIEELEDAKRGLYSGAVGYFSPNGDFDFNVVIRSILYHQTNQYISYSVGGAITARSIPVSEYEECLVKAKAMRMVLDENLNDK
ncbi:MAG: aminodeoxychorismate synthase component I [Flavobacteriaceae bacterium]|nr:aminodeoxychorismate synthase component I [Flavobacteriaceae bacterium]